MSRTHEVARAARRRLGVRDLVNRLGPALVVGSALGLGAVVAERVLGASGLAWWVVVAVPVAGSAAGAAAIAAFRRRSLLEAGGEVDAALGLRDRLSTGLAFSGATAGPFASIAVEDGERAAGGVALRRAIPVRFGSSWWAWPVLLVGAVGAGWLLPEWNLLRPAAVSPLVLAERERARVEAAKDVVAAVESIRATHDAPTVDVAGREQLAVLEQIEQELADGRVSPEEARRVAAAAMDEVAKEKGEAAEEAQRRADALREQLAQAGAGGGNPSGGGSGSVLSDALRRGDVSGAAKAAEAMSRELAEMTPEERAKAAESLEHLAEDLEALSRPEEKAAGETGQEQARPGEDPREQKAVEALQDQGLSKEQASRLSKETDGEKIREELEKNRIDPETARRAAEKIAEQNRERRAEEQAAKERESLARSLKSAAQSLREREQTNEAEATKEGGASQQREERNGAGRGSEKDAEKRPEKKPGDSRREEGSSQKDREGGKGAGEEERASGNKGDQPGSKGAEGSAGAEGEKGGQERREEGSKGRGEKDGSRAQGGDARPKTDQKKTGAGEGDKKEEAAKGEQPTGGDGRQKNEAGNGAPDSPRQGADEQRGTQPGEQGRPSEKDQGRDEKKETGDAGGGEKEQGRNARAGEKKDGTEKGPGTKDERNARTGGETPKGGETPGADDAKRIGDKPEPGAGTTPTGIEAPKGLRSGGEKASDGKTGRPTAGKPGETSGGEAEATDTSRDGAGGEKPVPGAAKPGGGSPEGATDGSPGEGVSRLTKQLKDLENSSRGAERDGKSAQELADKAREMWDRADPETRERMKDWAQQMSREQGNKKGFAPGDNAPVDQAGGGGFTGTPSDRPRGAEPSPPLPARTTVVDGRSTPPQGDVDPSRERVVAEWLGDGKSGERVSRQEVEARISEAAQSAERAIGDDRTVHSRYDKLIRRYFRRLPDNIVPAGEPPAPSSP
ncbi:MAG: hypothetical protein KF745_01770 [Phycisphaeraceae bacterium]|nr:hypothetical protein [Phycisphaeraceae bacterium]